MRKIHNEFGEAECDRFCAYSEMYKNSLDLCLDA